MSRLLVQNPNDENRLPGPFGSSYIGVDPSPTGGYVVSAHVDDDAVVDVFDYGHHAFDTILGAVIGSGASHVTIERAAGVMYGAARVSKQAQVDLMLTSESAGRIHGLLERYVQCSFQPRGEAMTAIGAKVGASPRKDSELREALMAVFGGEAFDKAKLCRKRGNKSHGTDCELCHGLGNEKGHGLLHRLTTVHSRDAFAGAYGWLLMRGLVK